MTILTQADFNAAITFLQGSKLDELLSLYVEAKTGSYGNEDRLPSTYFNMVGEMGVMINSPVRETEVGDLVL